MNLIYQAVKRVEISRFTANIKNLLIKNLSHSILLSLGLLVIYVISGALTIQMIINMELDLNEIYINMVKVSIIFSTFFVIMSRNSFKADEFVFFYLNTKIKAHQIIFSRILLPFTFYFFVLVLIAVPIMVGILVKGYTVNLFYVLLLLMSFTISYFLSFTLWMVINIFTIKLTGVKEKFWLNTLIKITIIAGIIYLIDFLGTFLVGRDLPHVLAVLLLSIAITYFFVRFSLEFLTKTFMQKDAGNLSQKYTSKNLNYKNKFLLQSKLETIHFFRDQVFKEQSFFFIILLVIVICLYYYLDLVNFTMIYSVVINFGLKEIILLLPLSIGIHFRKYKEAIYTLNVGKYHYFLSRIFFIYILNCLTYFLFITISYFLTGMEVFGILETFIIIGFVTMVSTMVSFVIEITELNKIYILIFLLLVVNIFDILIKQLFNNQILVQFTYISLSVIMFLIIETIYLRRPILK
ncbi:hypothetical protein CUC15_16510 [Oceanobacillus zhaokaii]|uniref:Uncharacterized protein n=2 Tax=Oceanobacillus zhaokaii TaxID=2052660 RepID=A0A345PKA5_9BACI|nr:hypothetical protein CUC15_16510 [Oceanobacillus zhaokaii]